MEKKFLTFIGLMSGTSLDGVDGVLVRFPECEGEALQLQASAHQSFSPELKQQALALQQAGTNEIEREALLANALGACTTMSTSLFFSRFVFLTSSIGRSFDVFLQLLYIHYTPF